MRFFERECLKFYFRIHRFIVLLAPLRPEEVGDKLPEGVKECFHFYKPIATSNVFPEVPIAI